MNTINRNLFLHPRKTPDRDSRYMGLAWIIAGFSKDPHTQIGAQIVDKNNIPLGHGYNGPPRAISDDSFNWSRESQDDVTKYDLIVHAEINAIYHSGGKDLSQATIYVTALPCPKCMLEIVSHRIARVVYYEYKSSPGSTLQIESWIKKTRKIAEMGNVQLEKFNGDISWIKEWTNILSSKYCIFE